MSIVDISTPLCSLMNKVINMVYVVNNTKTRKVEISYPIVPNLISSASEASSELP